MHIMYVDESGNDSLRDNTAFFLTSGVIFHEDDLDAMKQAVQTYKDVNFTGDLQDASIHVHDMYNSKREFKTLKNPRKRQILDILYDVIGGLPMTIITVGINKTEFFNQGYHARYNVLDMSYAMITERFDFFLKDNNCKGVMRIDRTTNPEEFKLNSRDSYVLRLINGYRKRGTNQQRIENIIEEPQILDSSSRKGLQVADAVAYCTSRHVLDKPNFRSYWNIIKSKLRTNQSGISQGFGFRLFPR